MNLPGYSPDFNADEAVWGWAREEVTGNLCLAGLCTKSKKAMEAIALARHHLWRALEGFSLSAADPDIQELPVALHHPLADHLGHAA